MPGENLYHDAPQGVKASEYKWLSDAHLVAQCRAHDAEIMIELIMRRYSEFLNKGEPDKAAEVEKTEVSIYEPRPDAFGGHAPILQALAAELCG